MTPRNFIDETSGMVVVILLVLYWVWDSLYTLAVTRRKRIQTVRWIEYAVGSLIPYLAGLAIALTPWLVLANARRQPLLELFPAVDIGITFLTYVLWSRSVLMRALYYVSVLGIAAGSTAIWFRSALRAQSGELYVYLNKLTVLPIFTLFAVMAVVTGLLALSLWRKRHQTLRTWESDYQKRLPELRAAEERAAAAAAERAQAEQLLSLHERQVRIDDEIARNAADRAVADASRKKQEQDSLHRRIKGHFVHRVVMNNHEFVDHAQKIEPYVWALLEHFTFPDTVTDLDSGIAYIEANILYDKLNALRILTLDFESMADEILSGYRYVLPAVREGVVRDLIGIAHTFLRDPRMASLSLHEIRDHLIEEYWTRAAHQLRRYAELEK